MDVNEFVEKLINGDFYRKKCIHYNRIASVTTSATNSDRGQVELSDYRDYAKVGECLAQQYAAKAKRAEEAKN
jgi:hypothetical protein